MPRRDCAKSRPTIPNMCFLLSEGVRTTAFHNGSDADGRRKHELIVWRLRENAELRLQQIDERFQVAGSRYRNDHGPGKEEYRSADRGKSGRVRRLAGTRASTGRDTAGIDQAGRRQP